MNILDKIKAEGNVATSKIIKDLIADHEQRAGRMKELYQRYKSEDLPIYHRKGFDPEQANNMLVNSFRGNIIDQSVGYMFGEPIQYNLEVEDETEKEEGRKWLRKFRIRNQLEDLDSVTGKFKMICGYGARLVYIDKNLDERVMNLEPWEVIVIKDRSLNETQYALRYYRIDDNGEERLFAEWYDKKNIYLFIQSDTGEFVPYESDEEPHSQPHLFDYVPVVKFPNNDEEQGDFEVVESLIDAYDRIVSDAQNIIEDFRSAYLVFENSAPPTKQEVTEMKRARALAGQGTIKYLTKEMNDEFLENQKATLSKNIYKFSQSVDMDDEAFHSAESGEARKWRLMALENKVITKERKFDASLRNMFKILMSYRNGIQEDYLNFTWEFRRNVPVDLQYLGDVVSKFKGIVSTRRILSLLPFVDDPDKEMEALKEEMDMMGINLDELPEDDDDESEQ